MKTRRTRTDKACDVQHPRVPAQDGLKLRSDRICPRKGTPLLHGDLNGKLVALNLGEELLGHLGEEEYRQKHRSHADPDRQERAQKGDFQKVVVDSL